MGSLPSPAQRVHQAVLPARQRRRGNGSRPGPAQRRAGPAQAPDSGRPAPRKRHPSGGDGDRRRCRRRSGRDEKRLGEPDHERAAGRRGLAGPHAAHPQAPAGTGAASRRGAAPPNHWKAQRSGAPAGAGGPESGGSGAPGGAGHRALRLAASGGGGSNGRLRFGSGERRRRRPWKRAELWPLWAKAPWRWPALRAQRQGDWWPRGRRRPWSARLGRSREESTCSAGAPRRAEARTATPRGPPEPRMSRP